jgi:hypothetical protein
LGIVNSQQETFMNTATLTIGRRLIPSEHVALVEPFEPSPNGQFQTTRQFFARVVLLNRESVLIEQTPQAFAEAHGFRLLRDDRVATNPMIHFRVETFEPAEGFTPAKAYASRLLWRDLDGNEQSKLLLSLPEDVLAVAVRGEAPVQAAEEAKPRRQRRAVRSLEVQ